MKRKTKTVMLAACALIVLGAAIFACAFAAADFDIHRLSTPEDSNKGVASGVGPLRGDRADTGQCVGGRYPRLPLRVG